MNEQPQEMDFTPEIEGNVLKIILTDNNFISYWQNRLREVHFKQVHHKFIFRNIEAFLKENNCLPTRDILVQECKKTSKPDDNVDAIESYIDEVLNKTVSRTDDYVKKLLMEHMKKEDFREAIFKSVDFYEKKEYENIEETFKKIVLKHTLTPLVPEYLAEGESVAERVAEERRYIHSFPSPWPTLNENHGGGFQEGTVTVFMGPSGSGKSIVLCNIGAALIKSRRNVYHFTFELSRKKTMARYDVILTKIKSDERLTNPKLVDEELNKLKNNGMGKLIVIEIPTGTCTTNMIRSTIDEYVSKGYPKPDVVILDYMTIMTPNNPKNVDMKSDYSKLKTIAEEVRAMAMERKYSIVSAVQSNRGSKNKEKIGTEDIADSFAVVHVLDCVISINQTDSERQAGKIRLFTTKVRDFVDNYTIVGNVNYDVLTIEEDRKYTQLYNASKSKTSDSIDETFLKNHGIESCGVEDPDSISAAIDNVCAGVKLIPKIQKKIREPTTDTIEATRAVATICEEQTVTIEIPIIGKGPRNVGP